MVKADKIIMLDPLECMDTLHLFGFCNRHDKKSLKFHEYCHLWFCKLTKPVVVYYLSIPNYFIRFKYEFLEKLLNTWTGTGFAYTIAKL